MNKKNLFLYFVLVLSAFKSYAQDIRINSIPFGMHFENKPLDFKIMGDDHIQITAPGNSDLLITSDGGYSINNSPRLLFKPDSSFIFTSKVKLDFKSKWDAGDLLLYNDSLHFAKFCFEKDYQNQPRVVSVVCNDTADDCNSMAIDKDEVYFRIIGSSKGNTFAFYYSSDQKSWYLVRTFRLENADNLHIGFSAQSPVGKGCQVDFSDIELQQRKPDDLWKGL